MRLYAAFDLHSSNSYLGIVEESGKRKFKRRLRNQPEIIRETLEPFKADIAGIVVELTYNWYWLVDFPHGGRLSSALGQSHQGTAVFRTQA